MTPPSLVLTQLPSSKTEWERTGPFYHITSLLPLGESKQEASFIQKNSGQWGKRAAPIYWRAAAVPERQCHSWTAWPWWTWGPRGYAIREPKV